MSCVLDIYMQFFLYYFMLLFNGFMLSKIFCQVAWWMGNVTVVKMLGTSGQMRK